MNDDLYHHVRCPYRRTLPVLGIPTRFETNSARIMGAVERAFGPWASLRRRTAPVGARPATVRLIEHDPGRLGGGSLRLAYRVPDDEREIVIGAGSVGISDVRRREVLAYVAPTLVRNKDHFRHSLLEGLTFGLLTRLGRYPLHAAAVVRSGKAYLLAGPSGVGKSTLAYAVIERGFRLLSEDLVFLQGGPVLRVWGHPGALRLPRDAYRHFPGLPRGLRTLSANGKRKLLVPRPGPPVSQPDLTTTDVVVCLVDRGGSHATLQRLSPREVRVGLQRELVGGYALFTRQIGRYLERLARNGGWRLRRGRDPAEAARCLEELAGKTSAG